MSNRDEASRLAKEGRDSWNSGDLTTAEHKFRRALQLCDEHHWSYPDLHGQLGKVLAALGRDEEGLQHLEAALASERRQYEQQEVSPVRIQRHFLAEHLLKLGRLGDALSTVEEGLRAADEEDATNLQLRIDRAVLLHSAGRYDEALVAARETLSVTPPKKIQYVEDRLKLILADTAG